MRAAVAPVAAVALSVGADCGPSEITDGNNNRNITAEIQLVDLDMLPRFSRCDKITDVLGVFMP